jgi:hypothetical protein
MKTSATGLALRDLPLASRLVLTAFLLAVGIGYGSALVQLHFQHASPGKLLPDAQDAADAYHGRGGMSQLERLLVADEGKSFNGSGSMRQAFTTRSAGWRSAINRRAKEKQVSLAKAEAELRSERDGERLALLDWVRTGADQETFEGNNHVLSASLGNRPMSEEFIDRSADGTTRVQIAAIVEARCARCHNEGSGGQASQLPLESWEHIHEYCEVETAGSGMSLPKLAQTTHVHLFGFAILYGLTGLIVSFTSYPGWVRAILAPLPLLAQIVDIGCWWLARSDPGFASVILVTGSVVAVSLFGQIVLSQLNMFGKFGKGVVVAVLLAACLGGYVVKDRVIDPYLARERVSATLTD